MAKDFSEYTERKVPMELMFSSVLLLAVFILFGLIATFSPTILGANPLLTYQLVLAIPMLAASSLIRIKLTSNQDSLLLDNFGHLVFVLGYVGLLNSIAILLSSIVSPSMAVIFLIVNISIALIYSTILVSDGRDSFGARAAKDILFTVLVLAFGIFPIIY